MLARVTGVVLDTETKSGHKNGRDWTLEVATVLVANRGVAEVSRFPDGSPSPLTAGAHVDLLVDVSARGGFTQASVKGVYPEAA
jgi:hypothetical protein